MNAASLQISAVLAPKATLSDGQYGFCASHSSARALKGGECVVLNLLYLVCIASMLRCVGGTRSESGGLSRKERCVCKAFSLNEVWGKVKHIWQVSPLSKFLSTILISLFISGVLHFIMKSFTQSFMLKGECLKWGIFELNIFNFSRNWLIWNRCSNHSEA